MGSLPGGVRKARRLKSFETQDKTAATGSGGRAAVSVLLKELFDAGDVFRDVDADGVVLDLDDANLPAVFHPAELFELFDAFQLTLREGGIFKQGFALKDVQT
jgi:hypothetical protein